tara:strand:+ start:4667 stop:5011 length:345 start_codon:yes stop_codon:yes gene_type:complete
MNMIVREAITMYDFSVLEGYRSPERQDMLFRDGKSKLPGGKSKHNVFPSIAVDLAPFPIDWNDLDRFVFLAGVMHASAHAIGFGDQLRWGGDWDMDHQLTDERFRDLGHFELVV